MTGQEALQRLQADFHEQLEIIRQEGAIDLKCLSGLRAERATEAFAWTLANALRQRKAHGFMTDDQLDAVFAC
ncbi:hypothetical protein [Oharaeibacter diazotrophicus]|uniref:Uncharacterized protein n=1 Tax=Oharaeibacter diazotrophicus TaxID=1920512 RepID=A0A4R6RJC4_9HYPH|nr:hypothetical protein [Oharaeibacter diazotrophicus]TDP86205.1 hypothetical protein EDD54_0073 [Oharaeibacter diazotrophicus]BBE71854.1 hypothetical protein OHA_1_01439 [Pleomorphomonas sp. SM30]GLS78618.1 hypothetical protein GCM10007904_39550 [Oharaeibacter diazotrophicus]